MRASSGRYPETFEQRQRDGKPTVSWSFQGDYVGQCAYYSVAALSAFFHFFSF
jgi:hypothetical protein